MKRCVILVVKQDLEVFFRADSRVLITLGAFIEVVVELLRRAGFLTFFALEPNAFRHIFLGLGGGGNAFAQAFVPTHGTIF